MTNLDVELKKPLEGTTVHFKVKKTAEFKIRFWLGLRLIKLGVVALGATAEVIMDVKS